MNAWEKHKLDKAACKKIQAQIHVLKEDKKATFNEPDGKTGNREIVEPDGTQSVD